MVSSVAERYEVLRLCVCRIVSVEECSQRQSRQPWKTELPSLGIWNVYDLSLALPEVMSKLVIEVEEVLGGAKRRAWQPK